MDHIKAYELIGGLSTTIDLVASKLELVQGKNTYEKWDIEAAQRLLKSAQSDHQQFMKERGWDTKGEK